MSARHRVRVGTLISGWLSLCAPALSLTRDTRWGVPHDAGVARAIGIAGVLFWVCVGIYSLYWLRKYRQNLRRSPSVVPSASSAGFLKWAPRFGKAYLVTGGSLLLFGALRTRDQVTVLVPGVTVICFGIVLLVICGRAKREI